MWEGAQMSTLPFSSVEELEDGLRQRNYLPHRGLSTAIYLTLSLDKPLLLEGEAGVGKTEVAKVLADLLGRELIRLQCYEGIDAAQALYEWDYARQLIAVRAAEAEAVSATDLFGLEFLVERPLLAAIRAGSKCVLLIDELDRADDEFEAFLLEILSEFSVTIPEIGRAAAERPPAVVITSNRTRELHDALKRRCLYHWIEFPDLDREVAIIRLRAPGASDGLALVKPPGAAEAIDWAQALSHLGAESADGQAGRETLGWAVKNREDLKRVEAALGDLDPHALW